ncbi:MAG: hypothetical protein KDD69_11300 [Bdellovibrionales bacterium]|nr:hypothetical protein [Bdellovibrionales bacterium]
MEREGLGKVGASLIRLAALLVFSVVFFVCELPAQAQQPGLVRFCTQNLFRYDDPERKTKAATRRKQLDALIERMASARCDVVALQEVMGRSKREALQVATRLGTGLSRRTGRQFEAIIGDTNTEDMRNGMLVASDTFTVQKVRSYRREPAPKLSVLGPPTYFPRGPLAVELLDKRGGRVLVITMHLKSKANAWKDPTGTTFESLRLQLAEGLRRLALAHAAKLGTNTRLVILGDRNSSETSASADVLAGVRTLADFSLSGRCGLDGELRSECEPNRSKEGVLKPLIEWKRSREPKSLRGGTYRYRNREEILDEIYVPLDQVSFYTRRDGSIAAGLEGRYYRGSDHKLAWAEMRW